MEEKELRHVRREDARTQAKEKERTDRKKSSDNKAIALVANQAYRSPAPPPGGFRAA